jgi:hypothetical protein
MPKPSPRKLGKARDINDSPDNKYNNVSMENSIVDGMNGD